MQAGGGKAAGGVQGLFEQIAAVALAPPALVDGELLQLHPAGSGAQAAKAHRLLFFIKGEGKVLPLPVLVDAHGRPPFRGTVAGRPVLW